MVDISMKLEKSEKTEPLGTKLGAWRDFLLLTNQKRMTSDQVRKGRLARAMLFGAVLWTLYSFAFGGNNKPRIQYLGVDSSIFTNSDEDLNEPYPEDLKYETKQRHDAEHELLEQDYY